MAFRVELRYSSLKSKSVKNALENQIGLSLINLSMNDWRKNKSLRDAVIMQIELMHKTEFKDIHTKFDRRISVLKTRIQELKTAIKK